MKLKLIPDWRNWWRFWSLRLGALGTALAAWLIASPEAALAAWAALPQDLKAFIPPDYMPFIGVGLFVLSMFARVTKQEKLPEVPVTPPKVEDAKE